MTTLASALEERIDTTGGLKIFVRSWRPATTPRGVIAICHGVKSTAATTGGWRSSSSPLDSRCAR